VGSIPITRFCLPPFHAQEKNKAINARTPMALYDLKSLVAIFSFSLLSFWLFSSLPLSSLLLSSSSSSLPRLHLHVIKEVNVSRRTQL
jgi:hypothetical protein